jgi:signal transduction histidine kinase
LPSVFHQNREPEFVSWASRVPRWNIALNPQELLSWPVISVISGYLLLSNIADPNSGFSGLPIRVVAIAASILVLFFIIWCGLLLARRVSSDRVAIAVMVTSVVVGTTVKSLALAWLLWVSGLDPVPLWGYRLGATLSQVVMIIVTWAAVCAVSLHYSRLGEMLEENRQLAAMSDEVESRLDAIDHDATEAVRSSILAGLQSPGNADVGSVVNRLTETIDEVVRPLSRQLETQSPVWAPPSAADVDGYRINWRHALLEAADPRMFRPLLVTVSLLLLGVPLWLPRYGALFTAEFLLLVLVVAAPTSCVFTRVAVGWARRFPSRRGTLFLGLLLSISLLYALITLPLARNLDQPGQFLTAAVVISITVSLLWSFATAAHRQARTTELELEAVSAELRWHIARVRELHRQRCRALAHAVHGQIQAALAGGILQLQGALKSGTVDDDLIAEVQDRILESVATLNMQDVPPNHLADILAKLRSTWQGVATITDDVPPSMLSRLGTDSHVLVTLNDVIPELVFNSIKHGTASSIAIRIEEQGPRSIRLIVTDNGFPVRLPGSTGMGSRLLDDCSIEWSRVRDQDGTVTILLLPTTATSAP